MPKTLLINRPSGLYVRFFVPVGLQAGVGSTYLVRSLQGVRANAARLMAAAFRYALNQVFERLRLEAVPNAKNLLDAALQGLRQVRCPSARRALRGPSADGFQHCVNMLGIDKAAEAVQAVTEDLRIWCQVTCSPGISG